MNKEDQILALLEKVIEEQASMKSEITGIKTDVSGLKSDMAGMKSDQASMKSDMASLKSDVANLNHEIAPKINIIYDGVLGLMEKNKVVERIEKQVEEHDDRIFALEQKVPRRRKAGNE